MRRHRSATLLGMALMAPLVLHLVAGAVQAAAATDTPAAVNAPSQTAPGLGGYTLDARGNGVRLLYDIPGATPLGTLVDIGVPESQTRLATGPVGSALSGLGYPGPVVLGAEVLLDQGGVELPFSLPDYPFVIQTDSSGPTEVIDDQTVPGSFMSAKVDGTTVEALTIAGGVDADPILTHSGIRVRTSGQVGSTADTTTVVEVSNIVVLGGLVRIDSVTTELSATSDGAVASTAGGTSIAGASLLGEAVEIGPDGIRFVDPPPDSKPNSGGVLDELGGVLDRVTQSVTDVLDADGLLNEILGQIGITIRLAEPRATGVDASAERVSEGLVIEFEQELGDTALAPLLDAVPELPGIPGAPLGPNDLLAVLQARHVASISIGGGSVAAAASPAFDLPPFEVDIDTDPAEPVVESPVLPDSGPSSGPAAPGSGGSGGQISTGPISTDPPFQLPGIIGPGMVFAALLGGLVLSLGTRKLPDWAIDGRAMATGPCDLPPVSQGDLP